MAIRPSTVEALDVPAALAAKRLLRLRAPVVWVTPFAVTTSWRLRVGTALVVPRPVAGEASLRERRAEGAPVVTPLPTVTPASATLRRTEVTDAVPLPTDAALSDRLALICVTVVVEVPLAKPVT